MGHSRPRDRLTFASGEVLLERQSRAVAALIVAIIIGSLVFGTLFTIFAPPPQ